MSAVAAERGVAVAGDVRDSVIVTGDHATIELHVGSRSGAILELLREAPAIRALPRPVDARPARKPDHVGREAEVLRLFEEERVVSVHGEPGIGKTYVLVHAGRSEQADAVRDGVVYVFARGKSRVELLQELFEAFHESDAPIRRGERQLLRDVVELEALLLLDSVDLAGDELQALVGALPAARVVVAADERRLWEGAGVALEGLPAEQALSLVELELGRPLEPGERDAADALCAALAGHPQRIRRAVAEAVAGGRSLAEAARVPEPPLRLSEDERAVVAALAAASGERVGAALVSRLADVADLNTVLEELERRRLVTSHSPRWSLAPGVAEALRPAPVRIGAAAAWAEREAGLATVLEEAPGLLALLRAARQEGRDADAIRLGRALAPVLAWGRRWDAWREAVSGVLDSARRVQDRAAEGWALNERGARAFGVGDVAGAKDALVAALDVREKLGDAQDLAVTRHNLQVVTGPLPPPDGHHEPRLPRWLGTTLAVVVAAGVLAGGGVGAWRLITDGGDGSGVAVEVEGPGRVVSEPAGIDCPGECEAEFGEVAEVVLAAAPDEGVALVGWEGDCADAPGTTCRLQAGEARSARAVFARDGTPPTRVVLEVVAGGGRVRSDPPGIECPEACGADFPAGASVWLEAAAARGFGFGGWAGACDGSREPVCEVVLERDVAVVARFEPLPGEVELRVDTPRGGRIESDPPEISCPERCVASFAMGTELVLTATADPEYVFARWAGACQGTEGPTCTLVLDEARSVGAGFDPVPGSFDLTVIPAEGGTISSEPQGISCPETCSATFTEGTDVTLTGTAQRGFRHSGWTGACSEATGTSCRLTLNDSVEVGARFEALATLTLRVSGGRLVSREPELDCRASCRVSLPAGTELTLEAQPSVPQEFTFVDWGGACAKATGTRCTLRVAGLTFVSAVIETRS